MKPTKIHLLLFLYDHVKLLHFYFHYCHIIGISKIHSSMYHLLILH